MYVFGINLFYIDMFINSSEMCSVREDQILHLTSLQVKPVSVCLSVSLSLSLSLSLSVQDFIVKLGRFAS